MTTPVPYRPEIDGLRAIAVSSVILFHLGLPFVPGGFLGVDLFFVISGYLITAIIVKGLQSGTFSIAEFYIRRARRILPALNVMMLLAMALAVWLMLPDDLENFGQSAVATTLFSNNMLLMITSGYFGLDNELKPLLHTWSLGVEEQYYFAIPCILWLATKLFRKNGPVLVLSVLSGLSFLLAAWAAARFPVPNFYLVLTRAWELGAGGLAYLVLPSLARLPEGLARPLASPRVRGALAFLGLGLILGSMVLLSEEFPMPSGWTIFVIVGSCLVLMFADAGSLAGRLLSLQPMVWLGLISYSAYLYHQPVFAFVRLISLEEPPLWLMCALVVPTLVLSWLSWRFVEQPFRSRKIGVKTLLVTVGASSVLILAAGLGLYATSGFYAFRPELASGDSGFGMKQNAAYNLGPQRFMDTPFDAAPGKLRVLVIGNSFARDFINMGDETGVLDGHVVRLVQAEECDAVTPETLALAGQADLVILATNFTAEAVPCVQRNLAQVERVAGGRAYVLGLKGFGYNNNAVMLLPAAQRYEYRALPIKRVRDADRAAAALFGDRYLNVLDLIEDGEGRVRVFTPARKFISQDRAHLTKAGAVYVGERVFSLPALAPLRTSTAGR